MTGEVPEIAIASVNEGDAGGEGREIVAGGGALRTKFGIGGGGIETSRCLKASLNHFFLMLEKSISKTLIFSGGFQKCQHVLGVNDAMIKHREK